VCQLRRRAARGARETLGRADGERNLLACSGERQKRYRLLFILESQMTRLLEPVFLNFTDGEWDTEPVGDALSHENFRRSWAHKIFASIIDLI